MIVEAGASVRAHPGERRCGDAVVVRRVPDGLLFAVVDALGHGDAAAEVADVAVAHLDGADVRGGIEALVRGLDDALRGSRGAAALVCLAIDGSLEACGIGNVELRSDGVKLPVVVTPGILGFGVRGRLRVFGGRLAVGARLVLFSDGVSGRLRADEARDLPPVPASSLLLERHARAHDDAAVLVADVTP